MEMIKFQDMPYERPDSEVLKKAYEAAREKLLKAETFEEARKAFLDLQKEEEKAETMDSICYIRNTMDTTDEFYNTEIRAIKEADASLIPVRMNYYKALSESRFRRDLEEEFGAQLLRLVDAYLKTTDERIVPEVIREGEVSMDYQRDSAEASAEFRGEKCNFYGLLKHMESTDREERREAFLAWAGLYESISGKLDRDYDELVSIRNSMAEKLGYASYTDLAYLNMQRFDYGPDEAAAFRRQIKSRFFRSFLYYVPYAVLTAMTVPAIFYSTGSLPTAAFGTAVAVILAYFDMPLIVVALAASAAAFAAGTVIPYIV